MVSPWGDHLLRWAAGHSSVHGLHGLACTVDGTRRDAEACIAKKQDWAKGYGRKGAALHGMGRYAEAVKAYEDGLKIEPSLAMLTNGMAEADAAGRGSEVGAAVGDASGDGDAPPRQVSVSLS